MKLISFKNPIVTRLVSSTYCKKHILCRVELCDAATVNHFALDFHVQWIAWLQVLPVTNTFFIQWHPTLFLFSISSLLIFNSYAPCLSLSHLFSRNMNDDRTDSS